jgi:hypothetical protein
MVNGASMAFVFCSFALLFDVIVSFFCGSTGIQVAGYGRYIKRTFKLNAGDFPNDAVRRFLLKDD